MRDLIIGDCHFGIKSNSHIWLEQQIRFFHERVIPILDNKHIDRIIFLGDLTDVRYSIHQQVGIELKNMIRTLANSFNGKIIFVAGNHDYFSPVEEYAKYNSYEMLFGPEFLTVHKNVIFVNEDPYFDEGALFLPWYWTENPDHFDDMLYRYDMKHEVKCIYCHADLTCWPGPRIISLHGSPVYSGHIHYIVDDPIGNLHNVGAVFPLTFNDVNQDRFIYILDDYKLTEKIKNDITFKFVRIFNDDIFNVNDDTFDNAYVQICISQSKINKAQYIDQIKFLRSKYVDTSIRLHIIDDDVTDINNLSYTSFNTNIVTYIEENIPQNLNDKYNIIKKKLSEK